ncbi:blastula protease 10-like isoform X2 [Pocillopora verrucosa]|uniref:blastula protease 10-like isoform X2 n=1 Tax=Pocillopora verrucosa TaxID=203993 RepID=UPI00334128F9
MVFLLKEIFLLTIVASALALPWGSYEMDGTVDDLPPNGNEEIYPVVTNTDSKRAVPDLIVNDDKPAVDGESETFPDTTYVERESDENDETVEGPPPDGVHYPAAINEDSKRKSNENDETVEDSPPDGVHYPAAINEDSKRTFLPFDGNKKIRNKRGAVMSSNYLWKATTDASGKRIVKITYSYRGSPPAAVRKWVGDVTSQLERDTCLRFQETADNGHVQIYTNNNDGCYTDIGYRTKPQKLNLGTGCEYMGIVSHEWMHLLGFYHEFTREDRDNYITVYKDNLQAGIYDTEFKKRRQNNLDVSYDLNSVMQYDTNTFSKNGKHTMEAKSNPNRKLGSTSHFDANDLKKIDKLYCNGGKKFKDHKFQLKTGTGWGSGTDAELCLQLIGTKGVTSFRALTSGGRIQDEKERGANEEYNMPFEDVGEITKVKVRLVEEGQRCPSDTRKKKKKRFFSLAGYTLGNLEVDGTSYGGNIDLDPGDEKTLGRQ